MKWKFERLAKQISKKSSTPVVFKEVYVKKANEICLCAFFKEESSSFGYNPEIGLFKTSKKSNRYSIQLYSDKTGTVPISRINYLIQNNGRGYISSFVTIPQCQSKGFGRYIYNLALAHLDNLGATESYGLITPINEIREISNRRIYNEHDKIEFLKNTYESLGNTVKPLLNDMIEHEFSCSWLPHEKIDILNDEQKEFLYTGIEELTNTNDM